MFTCFLDDIYSTYPPLTADIDQQVVQLHHSGTIMAFRKDDTPLVTKMDTGFMTCITMKSITSNILC